MRMTEITIIRTARILALWRLHSVTVSWKPEASAAVGFWKQNSRMSKKVIALPSCTMAFAREFGGMV
jgi:hypothetical protein